MSTKKQIEKEIRETCVFLREVNQTDSLFHDNCWYYNEAQGRHHCTNDLVESNKCEGVCNHYRDKQV
jgi:hypothetical protein